MGKIFGISDLPVSTIMTPFEGVKVPEPVSKIITKHGHKAKVIMNTSDKDLFVLSKRQSHSSNPILNMRNGIGKLMKHFSSNPKSSKLTDV